MNTLDEVMQAYTAIADVYDDVFRVAEQTAANAAQTASILKRLGARDIVDAACGTGADTLLLWGTGDLDLLVANDLNDAMLGRMRERLHHSGTPFTEGWSRDSKGLAVTQMESTCLDQHLPPERFDAVLCTGIGFYHLLTTERFVAALRSWAKLLRPGGAVVLDWMDQDPECAEIRRAARDTSLEDSAFEDAVGTDLLHYGLPPRHRVLRCTSVLAHMEYLDRRRARLQWGCAQPALSVDRRRNPRRRRCGFPRCGRGARDPGCPV